MMIQSRHNLLESIVNEFNSPTRSRPISDVYELAVVIASHCSGAFDRRNTIEGEHLFLDMFESSIGDAMDRETQLFIALEKASRDASEWLEISRGIPGRTSTRPKSTDVNQAPGENDNSSEDNWLKAFSPRLTLLQTLLDIAGETDLLREIKDIRDELDILKMIFKQQGSILEEMKMGIIGDPKQKVEGPGCPHISKIFEEQKKQVENPLQDIGRMDKQAERVYNSITDLLELKQKHANAMQAADTARQGLTLMVFTVVTGKFLAYGGISKTCIDYMLTLGQLFSCQCHFLPHFSQSI